MFRVKGEVTFVRQQRWEILTLAFKLRVVLFEIYRLTTIVANILFEESH